ncbi:MAG TPA: hypothetical protein VG939_20865 [Caulobacteraceae bacterium]|nr:hypothetical protein [Caulobacteraceae bacterium]
MGQKRSWIAVEGRPVGEMLERLGLVETGEFDFGGDMGPCAAELDGWAVVVANGDFDYATAARLQALSAAGEAVCGRTWDTVMVSAAEGWREGRRVWSVTHNLDKDVRNLAVEGEAPSALAEIAERQGRLQDEAEAAGDEVDHLFEVPTGLSGAVCGFDPEGGRLPPETAWRAVEPVRTGKAGEAQAALRAYRERFTALVRSRLFPAAEALGFEPAGRHPDYLRYHRFGAMNVLVRLRGERAEIIELNWSVSDNAPFVAIRFFVVEGGVFRAGAPGVAFVPNRPSLLQRLTGRKLDEAAAPAEVERGLTLLAAVDRHLRDGSAQPNLHPALYAA